MTIGQKIRNERKDRCITGVELAKKTGLSAGMIFRVENNTKIPSLANLFEIAKALDIKTSYLISGTNFD